MQHLRETYDPVPWAKLCPDWAAANKKGRPKNGTRIQGVLERAGRGRGEGRGRGGHGRGGHGDNNEEEDEEEVGVEVGVENNGDGEMGAV